MRVSIGSKFLLSVVPALRVAQAGTRLTVYRLLDIPKFWGQRESVIFAEQLYLLIKFKYKRERKSLFFIKFDIK